MGHDMLQLLRDPGRTAARDIKRVLKDLNPGFGWMALGFHPRTFCLWAWGIAGTLSLSQPACTREVSPQTPSNQSTGSTTSSIPDGASEPSPDESKQQESESEPSKASPEDGSIDPSKDESQVSPDSESSEKQAPVCEGDALRCAAPTPAGWIGPMQLQKVSQMQDAVTCDPVFPKSAAPRSSGKHEMRPGYYWNIFVDKVTGTPARCSGCKAKFLPGLCDPPKWSLRRLDSSTLSGCGEQEIQEWGKFIQDNSCPSYNLYSEEGRGWAIAPAKAISEGYCTRDISQLVADKDPVEMGNFYRACKVKASELRCKGKHDTCVKTETESPWLNQVCIARKGDHKCKSATYPVKAMAHASFTDHRQCTQCKAETNQGVDRCDVQVYLQFNDHDECVNRRAVDLNSVCIPHDKRERLEPITATADPVKFSSTTVCIPSKTEPKGEVELTDPITFCCQKPRSAP